MNHLKLMHSIIRVFREDISKKLEFYVAELYDAEGDERNLIQYKIEELEYEDDKLREFEDNLEKLF